jgi:hypothetical protein
MGGRILWERLGICGSGKTKYGNGSPDHNIILRLHLMELRGSDILVTPPELELELYSGSDGNQFSMQIQNWRGCGRSRRRNFR